MRNRLRPWPHEVRPTRQPYREGQMRNSLHAGPRGQESLTGKKNAS